MRNGYYMPDLPPEYAPVIQDTSRQMKMADLLRQQSLDMPNGQMVSGHYVAPSITQYMAQMLKGYNANKMEEDALAKQQGAYDEWQGKLGEYGQKWADVIAPKVDLSQSEMPVEGPNGEITYGNTPTTVNNNEALAFLLQNPEAMNNPVIAVQAPQFLKAQEGFSGTLAPGAVAFQNGKQVAANPKADDKKPLVVDGVVLDPVTYKPLYTAPQKPEKPTADMQEYEYAKSQGYKGSFTDWQKELRRSGASSVSVGFPQETFKNEQSLRKEFQDLPTTKAFKEVQTAYDQITTALKNPSAANDLAAATKFMKLLDPGSVVRESELAMAMEATGKLDQFMNYANMIKTGEKLTASQRKDFASAANALYAASANRYNEAATEFRGMAGDYQLKADRIAKPATVKEPQQEVKKRKTINGVNYVHDGKGWKKE